MGVSPSAVSRVTGIEVTYKNFNAGKAQSLPQRVVIIGVGNDNAIYDLNKRDVFSSGAVAEMYGFGSPLHLAVDQLIPANGPAAEFPVSVIGLAKKTNATAAEGKIGATGTVVANVSMKIRIGGIAAEFAALKGNTNTQILNSLKRGH
jgi:phage tail sheath gpL-like